MNIYKIFSFSVVLFVSIFSSCRNSKKESAPKDQKEEIRKEMDSITEDTVSIARLV